MIVDLKNLPVMKAIGIVQYCWDNQIELKKCMDFIYFTGDGNLEFNIPDEHITWMTLKGYLNE